MGYIPPLRPDMAKLGLSEWRKISYLIIRDIKKTSDVYVVQGRYVYDPVVCEMDAFSCSVTFEWCNINYFVSPLSPRKPSTVVPSINDSSDILLWGGAARLPFMCKP